MSNDFELMHKYTLDMNYRACDTLTQLVDQAKYPSKFKSIDLIDLNMLRLQIDESIQFLFLCKRFRQLDELFKGKIVFDNNKRCFAIDDHEFQSLDEIEKAWKNRAFL